MFKFESKNLGNVEEGEGEGEGEGDGEGEGKRKVEEAWTQTAKLKSL